MFPSLVFLLVLSSFMQAEQLLSAALVMERGSSHLGISSSVVPPLPQPPPSVKDNTTEQKVEALQTMISALEDMIITQEKQVAGYEERFAKQETQLASVTQRLDKCQGSEAYFTVVANGKQSYSKQGATIKFHVTRVNVVPPGSKGGWNSTTHEYICPVNGDYLFIVSLFKAKGNEWYCAARLWHGGKILASLNNHQKIGHFTSSMHGIASCRAGDRVRVGTFYNNCKLFDSGSHLNQFSGVLLKRW